MHGDGIISNCNFGYSTDLSDINVGIGAQINNIISSANCGIQTISMNYNSSFGDFTIETGNIQRLILGNDSTLQNITLQNCSINGLELEPFTNMTESLELTDDMVLTTLTNIKAYSRPDGVTKIRYFNNDDNLVITDIDDTIS